MASAFLKDPSTKAMEDEEEEELFEIDLESVDRIPPPHYWESYFTATGSALLANCLLPIADVSNAVPTTSTLSLADHLLFFRIHSPCQNFHDLLGNTTKDVRT
ncbi:hypothetical protein MANES_08G024300v8 [Manihot esculenta]|uniref:Uncharacterized protein n=1 Tax=Manihot esculenta TaxID=3983 RepID=A0A2C9VD09_MANES|nr:hypothetical protein MANES_08G024300v8 [Manihot esculenta]